MSNESDVLDDFGALLIRSVRDISIRHWNLVIDGKMKDSHSQEIHGNLAGYSPGQTECIRRIVSMVVDTTIHNVLCMVEQNERISVRIETEGQTVAALTEISDGLAGELYTADGWIERFTTEYYEEP